MKEFMDENFLLTTATSNTLYNEYARNCPIIDYHCHINPRDIAQNVRFENISQVWFLDDHYKWRLMRAAGVDEKYITGNASDREKFNVWAKVLGRAVGNPLYHWIHLELRRYFDYYGYLSEKTADEVWYLTKERLAEPAFSARGLITKSNVQLICTTDDPIDNLQWHQQIAGDSSFHVQVLPTFRPDRIIDIEKPDFIDYLSSLEEASDQEISSLDNLKQALKTRIEFFAKNGCRMADHGLEEIVYGKLDATIADIALKKRLAGNPLSEAEICQYKTEMMLFFAEAYHEMNWTMQLHFGCRRDNNTKALKSLGPNTGFDCISGNLFVAPLVQFLDDLEQSDVIPRIILYSLNPNDNPLIDTVISCFQKGPVAGYLQHGTAWWFNNHYIGILDHLLTMANLGYLPAFVGMSTDSRSFLSYTRHEYFRRILCDLLGQMVEQGQFPLDIELLNSIVQNICYKNAARIFE